MYVILSTGTADGSVNESKRDTTQNRPLVRPPDCGRHWSRLEGRPHREEFTRHDCFRLYNWLDMWKNCGELLLKRLGYPVAVHALKKQGYLGDCFDWMPKELAGSLKCNTPRLAILSICKRALKSRGCQVVGYWALPPYGSLQQHRLLAFILRGNGSESRKIKVSLITQGVFFFWGGRQGSRSFVL